MNAIRVGKASLSARVCAIVITVFAAAGVTIHHLLPAVSRFVLDRPSTCLFKLSSGVACIGCRGTRSAFALANGDLVQCFLFSPMVAIFSFFFVGWAFFVTFTGRNVDILLTPPVRRLFWILVVAVLAGNWIYVICAEQAGYTPPPWPLTR